MTWQATTVDGLIVVEDGHRRCEILTNEPHLSNIGTVIAAALNALDDADGDPRPVTVSLAQPRCCDCCLSRATTLVIGEAGDYALCDEHRHLDVT